MKRFSNRFKFPSTAFLRGMNIAVSRLGQSQMVPVSPDQAKASRSICVFPRTSRMCPCISPPSAFSPSFLGIFSILALFSPTWILDNVLNCLHDARFATKPTGFDQVLCPERDVMSSPQESAKSHTRPIFQKKRIKECGRDVI